MLSARNVDSIRPGCPAGKKITHYRAQRTTAARVLVVFIWRFIGPYFPSAPHSVHRNPVTRYRCGNRRSYLWCTTSDSFGVLLFRTENTLRQASPGSSVHHDQNRLLDQFGRTAVESNRALETFSLRKNSSAACNTLHGTVARQIFTRRRFALFAYLGALLWATTFVSLGYFLGDRWQSVSGEIHHHMVTASLVAGALIVIYLVWRKLRRKVVDDGK